MLEAHDLHKVYHSGRTELAVLQGVSLCVERGDFIAITGASGAGKSTLLHLLAGLDSPSTGEVLWNERSLSAMNETQRAVFRNETIGIVFQFYHLLPELTALENVMLPGFVRGKVKAASLRQRAHSCLEQVGLSARVRHKPNALSGGELQRVAIARALVNEPQIILCDEPTGNLDSITGDEIAQLLVNLKRERGVSLLLATHEKSLASLADQTIVLKDGRIVSNASIKPSVH